MTAFLRQWIGSFLGTDGLVLVGFEIDDVQNISHPFFLENSTQSHTLPNVIQVYFS
jgi:hypothetical protein